MRRVRPRRRGDEPSHVQRESLLQEGLEARTKTLFRPVFGVKIVRGIHPLLRISGVFGQTSRWWYTPLAADCGGCLMSIDGHVQINGNEDP